MQEWPCRIPALYLEGDLTLALAMSTIKPPYCWRCHAQGVEGACRWCKAGGGGFTMLRSLHAYAGNAAQRVQEAKKSPDPLRSMGKDLGAYAKTLEWPVDMVVPVPLHRTARQTRGYNQARLLADEVAGVLDVPVRPDVAERRKDTMKQRDQKSIEGRVANMRGAFIVAPAANVEGSVPLVVDDVATTGQTLDSLARALKAGGAERVYALTYARTAPDSNTDPVAYLVNPIPTQEDLDVHTRRAGSKAAETDSGQPDGEQGGPGPLDGPVEGDDTAEDEEADG